MRFTPPHIALALLLTGATAHADVAGRVIQTYPSTPAALGKMEWLDIRLSYTSTEEVLFSPDAYFKGKRVFDENHFLGTRFLPAGSGEAAVAIAFEDSRKVDTVKVLAWGRSGKIIGVFSFPVNIRWTGHAQAKAGTTPDWAGSLETEQMEQARKTAPQAQSSGWDDVVLVLVGGLLMYAGIPGYFVLQVVAVRRLRNGWRKAAVLPVIPMALVMLYTIDAIRKESNLWPLLMIFTCPLAAIYLLVVLSLHRFRRKPPEVLATN
jgi:hypothetical protein